MLLSLSNKGIVDDRNWSRRRWLREVVLIAYCTQPTSVVMEEVHGESGCLGAV